MENKTKRFLSLVLAMVMVFGMFPMNAFATEAEDGSEAVVADLDFTDATVDESGEGWAWNNDNKTLTLRGVSLTSTVTLPADSRIDVTKNTVNSIEVEDASPVVTSGELTIIGSGSLTVKSVAVENEAPSHTVSGAEEIFVQDTSLTTYGYAGLCARNVTILNAQVDIKGYGYGIYSNQTTGSSQVHLENVSGSIVGELCCGIDLYVESNADNSVDDMDKASVDILYCQNLTISGEPENTKFNSNGHRSGIRVFTKDAETDAYVVISNSNVVVNGSNAGIFVNSHSDNSFDSDDASEAYVTIHNSTADISTIGSVWAAIFVNNNGTGEKATAKVSIGGSNVKALCPNDVGIMTSTANGNSYVYVSSNSTLELSGVAAGIRAKCNNAENARATILNSVLIVNSATKYVVDDMDNGTSREAVANSVINTNYVAAVDCVISANSDGTWTVPAGGKVIDDGVEYTTVNAYIDTEGNLVESENYYVAQVGENKYETLKDAVAAANAIEGGATVTLLDDVTLGETLTISGNVTIKGEYTITRADDFTKTLFTVKSGASLTLDGGLTIDGGNNYKFDSELYAADLANWESPVATADSAKWFTPEEGAPVATAYMITTTGGTVNLNNVTVQNNYSVNSGIISAGANSTITLTGANIRHNANITNSGLVANVSGAGINVVVNEGTVIDGNHVGGNHGIFKVYSGAVLTMNGGEIKNTTGWNSNGTVVGMYYGSFVLNGGTICNNSSVYGPSNGRNAAIYGHSGHRFTMNGGTICHNTGRSKAGIDSPYSESGYSGLTVITGGQSLYNDVVGPWTAPDVSGGETLTITGGWYTQDVSQWVSAPYRVLKHEGAGENGVDLYEVTDRDIAVTVTVNDITYVEGNEVPAYGYTTDVECPELDIQYSIDGEAINAAVTAVPGYTFTVVPGTLTVKAAVCEMNGIYYASLGEAVKAAGKAESTIKLLVSELTERVTVGHSVVQNITIDLNGAKLSSNDLTLGTNRAGTVLTLVNGTIYGNSKSGGSVRANNGAKVVLGEDLVINCGPHATGVNVNNGTLVINSNVQITAANNWLSTSASTKNTVIISAGTFLGGMSVGEGTVMQLSGGIYSVRPEDAWCVEGYEVKNYGKDMWTVGPVDCTITVDGVWYKDWEAAESAFAKDCVIKLFADQTNTQGTSAFVSKNTVTLDLNGYTLSSPFEKAYINSLPVEYTTLYVVDSMGGGKLIGNDSHSLFAYNGGVVHFNDGAQFIGSLQSTNGKGTFYVDGVELLGASENAIFQISGTSRIKMHENGDWTVSIGALKMNADYALAENNLNINKNCSIDLNGNALTAKSITAMGNLIDTADGVGVVTADKLWYNGHNNAGYLPIADGEGYRLFAVELRNLGVKPDGGNKVMFGVTVVFNEADAYLLLADSVVDGSIVANATFAESGDVSEGKFSAGKIASLLKAVYNQVVAGDPITYALTGAMTMNDNSVDVFAELFSGETNVVITSEVITYTK